MQRESIYDRMTNAEKEVANVLREFKIQWSFEQPVFVWDENKRPRVWAPDFYLVSFGIYVEVCGSEKFNYSYRKEILNRNGYQIIFLHLFKEEKEWKQHLLLYIKFFVDKRNRELNRLRKSLN
jgi:hypothetical protein